MGKVLKTAQRLLGAGFVLALLAAPAQAAATPQVTASDSLAQVRPTGALPSGGSSQEQISAAANEFESFQVAVDAGSAPVSGLDAKISDFSGPAGTIAAANVTL